MKNVNYGNGLVGTQTYNTNLQLKTLKVGSTPAILDLTYKYNEDTSNTGRIVSIENNVDRTKNGRTVCRGFLKFGG